MDRYNDYREIQRIENIVDIWVPLTGTAVYFNKAAGFG